MQSVSTPHQDVAFTFRDLKQISHLPEAYEVYIFSYKGSILLAMLKNYTYSVFLLVDCVQNGRD